MQSVPVSMASFCCFNGNSFYVRSCNNRNQKLNIGKFSQIPTTLSLNVNSNSIELPDQAQHGRIENLHLIALARQGKLSEAHGYLREMEDSGIATHTGTYRVLLEVCGLSKSLTLGEQILQSLRKKGPDVSSFLYNCVLRMYCDCDDLDAAQQFFNNMPVRDDFSWSVIISAYSGKGLLYYAVDLFSQRLRMGTRPNASIYTSLLYSILDSSAVEVGKQLHSHTIRIGLSGDCSLSTSILNMYTKCGLTNDAKLVLYHMDEKNAVAWTAMMVGYAQADKQKSALELFSEMLRQDILPDDFAFSIVLKACSALGEFQMGRQIHGLIVKQGIEVVVSVGTPLVDFYAKCEMLESARQAFDRMVEPNAVSWSALITGYSRAGDYDLAVESFISARSRGVLNSYIYTSIFQVCASLAHLNFGCQVHADAIKRGLISYHRGESAMITMYSKCGLLDYAFRAFQDIDEPDAIAWTSIISGCAYHGNASKALELFKRMQNSGVNPNAVTFKSVFTACSHSGLVTEAMKYLGDMPVLYGVEPTIDHYVCVIDVYSRAGKLQEAYEMINTMPFEPDAMSWKALLGGCWMHRNLELGKVAAENALRLDPEDTASYILLFNLYTTIGKWDEAAYIRKLMAERNLRKEVGCSWIFVNGQVHRFIVGDRHHPQTEEIYLKLGDINFDAKDSTGIILTEDDVVCGFSERKEQLLQHSEKLAVAFGLISTPSDMPLLIYKNIRACKHCHDFVKHVSLVTKRKIVVRDANRFHHFVNGKCSCNDYW